MDTTRKPSWIRVNFPVGSAYQATLHMVKEHKLHTICQSAGCPNIGECRSRGTATLMILGEICTRSCNFCAVKTRRPTELDLGEEQLDFWGRGFKFTHYQGRFHTPLFSPQLSFSTLAP
jgi:lipoic acid synthetase|tara:strand:- start:521 stop:877 length:357 start_codon:yes stop_codon:yes gene_type:complete